MGKVSDMAGAIPSWSRLHVLKPSQTRRRDAKRRLEATGGTSANRFRESGGLAKTRPDRARRQEWQIVQSWFNLDDSCRKTNN